MFVKGQVVRSTAGRDSGCLLVCVNSDGASVFVCDGKERPLCRPKRKNPKHVEITGAVIAGDAMRSDRALRKALAVIECGFENKEVK